MMMTDYLSKGSTVTGTYYAVELRILHEALKSKRHPPYSPDVAPSDFCLFALLIKDFSGTHVSNDSDVVGLWRSFFRVKINYSTRLVHRSCRNDGTSALKLAEIM